MRLVYAILFLLALIGAVFGLAVITQPDPVELWTLLEGPLEASHIGETHAADVADYERGSETRLAVLLTDEGSNWLGLAHGLKTPLTTLTLKLAEPQLSILNAGC